MGARKAGMQAIYVQSTDDVSCRTSRADVFAEQREAGDVTVAHHSVQSTHQSGVLFGAYAGISSRPPATSMATGRRCVCAF